MANIIKKAAEKIKNTYSSIDTKLGGYLPGGSTPSEVAASKVSLPTGGVPPSPASSPAPPQQPNFQPADGSAPVFVPPSGNFTPRPLSGNKAGSSRAQPEVVPTTPAEPALGPYASFDARHGGRLPGGVPEQPSYNALNGKFEYPFFSEKGQQERLTNIYDTLRAGVGFGELDARTPSPLTNKVLEAAGEHPFQTAAYATGIISAYNAAYGLITAAVTRGAVVEAGLPLIEGTIAKVAAAESVPAVAGTAVNTVTSATKLSYLANSVKGGVKLPKASTFVLGTLAGWITTGVLAQNEWGDAIQGLSIAITQAEKAGDIETARELKAYLDEISPERMNWYLGPIAYIANVDKKIESGMKIAETTTERIESDYIKAVRDEAIADRINSGIATPAEEAQYAKDNPFSPIAANWAAKQKNLDANGNSVFGTLDEQGNYVPSNTELAKQEWENANKNVDANGNSLFGAINENGVYVPSFTELAKRLESQQYYNSLGGGGGASASAYEPPSSLNFGLLRTSGGYETVSKDDTTATERGEFVTDANEIATSIFGIPYTQLTDIQKQVVDMMK